MQKKQRWQDVSEEFFQVGKRIELHDQHRRGRMAGYRGNNEGREVLRNRGQSSTWNIKRPPETSR